MKPAPSKASPLTSTRHGVLRRWFGSFMREQMDMAYSKRQREFAQQTKEGFARVRAVRLSPGRVETFEQAVARKRLSPQFLHEQMQRHKTTHLVLYALAGALLVYALYLGLNFSVFAGAGSLVAAAGIAVNGYIHGFRAWQIENRNLIRFQDALCIPSTYLVL